MPLSFPGSPSVNDTYTVGQRTWTWDGYIWSLSADTIGSASVTSSELASNAVTTAKILDANVTAAKIASDAVTTVKILDANVTTAKILDANVTTAKIAANAITQAKLASNLSAVTVTTTANRDTDIAAPFTGQLAILTDTKKIQLYDGTSWVNVSLAPPETPTSLSATALSTTSVSIAFTAGGANGSPITNYKYALSTNGGSTYGSFIALDPADITTPITISGLTAGTTYYIKLKAVNDMGDSVASAAVSISTLATPDAPTSLSAGSITATSVDISFTAGSDNGYAISNYQYALSTDSGSTYGSFTALSPADFTTPITITGLTQGTAYYIKIKGVNNGGAGAESSAVSFTTLQSVTVNYLVVAGAGGGGARQGGGGGAGGLRSTVTSTGGGGSLETALALLLSTNYTVTVGAGGSGGPTPSSNGVSGSNSVFSTITSISGGYGGGESKKGDNGGSGGGSAWAYNASNSLASATGTANQGFAGGKSSDGSAGYGAGGGGGGGAVGVTGTYNAGSGGVGVATLITGSSVYYAGGGGGGGNNGAGVSPGSGGSGGGGSGSVDSSVGTAGTANLGGGGGGGGVDSPGGAGGSGIVILRYPSTKTITLGAGLTGSTTTVSSDKVTTITAGTGNVSWA
jgi:Fibronectin type III domain